MRQVIVLIAALLVGTTSFAEFSKGSSQLNALSSAWKNQPSVQLKTQNDITMGYGGEDVSHRPLSPRTAIA